MRPRVFKTPALSLAVALTLAACGRQPPAPPPPGDLLQGPGARPADATLDKVRARKRLKCGVTDGVPGFSERGLTGQWRGFDVDICRAVAAAVLGDARAVSITPLTSRTRYAALQSGAVDLVTGGASFTFTHDVALRLDFAGISYYDSQGFLTAAPKQPPAKRGAPPAPPVEKTVADLNGARICVQGGSSAQQVLAESFRARGMSYQPIVKDDRQQALEAYQHGDCDALTDDLSILAIDRSTLGDPDKQVVLTEVLADEPLGPVVREGDDHWTDIVRWTLNALILAEQARLGAKDVETARKDSVAPEVRRLLGVEGEAGRRLGLADDWAYRAIRQVGAYDEIFDRNLGPNTPLKLDRGRNALWNADKPGLLYAPPLR
jgi:general L-amino acid transport system substrate-binding protein